MESTNTQDTRIVIPQKKIQINTFNHQLAQPFHQQQPSKVISITIEGNSYSKQFCQKMGQYLIKTSKLQDLNINDIFVSRSKEEIPQSIEFISSGLKGSKLLRLDISNNAVNAFGAKALVNYLIQAQSLTVLLATNCGLGPLGVAEIAQGLKGTPKLRILAMGRNRMQNAGIISIAQIIKYIPLLQQLFVYQNTLKKQGLAELFKQLYKNCKNIISLDLCDSFIREKATDQMSQVLKTCLNLKNINLSDCLDQKQNQQIIQALQNSSNHSFERLGLNFIDLSPELALRLLKLAESYPLKRLQLMGNEFPKKIKSKYREYFGEQSQILSPFDDQEQQMIRLFEQVKL